MNVFKALEVFKRIPKLSPSLNPLRAVRGLWVSGEHRDPMTQDSVAHIKEVSSNQAEVRVYTETTTKFNEDEISYEFKGVYSQPFVFVDYTKLELSLDQEQSYVQITNLYTPTIEIIPYTIININLDQEQSYVQITNLYSPDITFIDNYQDPVQYQSTQPEPTLFVSVFTSNELEIE